MVKTINNNIDFGKRGNWKQVKLKDIAVKKNKKNKDSSISTVFSNSALNGIVEQKDFFDKDIANKDNLSSYYIVDKDDFVYNPRISSTAPCGPIRRNRTNKKGLVSPLYTVFKLECKECSLDYFEQYFKSSCWHKYMFSVANFGARSDRMNVTNTDFFNMKIKVPKLLEQQKIASILSTWDKAIELKEKLIEQKKEQKKGLMQKLLTGEVRLPGFSGEWKEVKLEKISVCLDNFRKPLNSKERERMKGNIPYYGANGIIDYVNDYLFNEPLILLAEDGGHFNEFREKAIAIKLEGKSWVNNHAHVLRIINSDINFVFYSMVHKDIRKYINGSTRGKLTRADMLKIELLLPNNIKEQKAIADILMKIDHNIELLEKELEQLKQQKKGLMQQLLTGKIRVKV